MDGANAISQTNSDSRQLGLIDAAKLLPEFQATNSVLNALPLELRLANLSENSGDAISVVPERTSEQIAGVKRRLEFLLAEFRAEAKVYSGLHHTLIVHFRKDDDWTRFTPVDKESWSMRPRREPISSAWACPELHIQGLYHARSNAIDATHAFDRLAKEATHAVRDLIRHDSEVSARNQWMIELYRTAWNSSEFSAEAFIWSGWFKIPVFFYDKVRAGHELNELEASVAPLVRWLECPPSCCCHTLSEDCFTASARKIAAILDYLVSGAGVWKHAAWFRDETGGALSSDTLLKAQAAKHHPVTARKVDGLFEYEVRSVCRKFPKYRAQILAGLN